ncbi:hypothetical protein SLEP1_g16022 [Rubroshorea leprosula]|uniref:Uncharacterized protein n=1 Tax=Rubroshorea leprosula TaxID=152421 RepID=A0AAV5IVH0_9ROSI|nr:hypothetical protein SLEP1_g16022 [Rubroshorea leprosula]
MDNNPTSLGRTTDPDAIQIEKRDGEVLDQVKTQASGSKLVGKKRRALEKLKKMAAKAARMKAETSNLRAEMGKLEAAAEEKEREVKLEKAKRDGCLAEKLLMSVTEHLLLEEIDSVPPE